MSRWADRDWVSISCASYFCQFLRFDRVLESEQTFCRASLGIDITKASRELYIGSDGIDGMYVELDPDTVDTRNE